MTWRFTPPAINTDLLELAFKSFMNTISENDEDTLISSEDFIWNNRLPEFIDHVKKHVDEIVVIMYVRRQVKSALSLYQTGVVNQEVKESFQEWFDKAKPLFDYYNIAKQWEKVGCKVFVKPFIRDRFEMKDVILDFLNTISQLTGKKILPPFEYKPNSIRINITIPDFITMMIRYYNSQDSKDKVVPVLRELSLKLIDLLPDLPKLDFVPTSSKRNILETYKESNKLLCEKYLGLEYLDWMNKEIEGDDKEFYERFGYSGAQLVELSKSIIKLINEFTKRRL